MGEAEAIRPMRRFASSRTTRTAQRSLEVAQTGLDQVAKAETAARTEPTVNNYLALSVVYFQARKI